MLPDYVKLVSWWPPLVDLGHNMQFTRFSITALSKAFDLAIPTPEHYLPLLYTLALKEENEKITFFNDKPVAGSLSMTSLKIESE